MMRSISAASKLLVAALVLSACAEASEPLAPEARSFTTGTQDVRAEEAEFFLLSHDLPGFGGYSYDSKGNLVAYMKDPARHGRAQTLLGAVLAKFQEKLPAERRAEFGQGQVIIRQGQYSFIELAGWRDRLSASVLDLPGVMFTDADETQNRVVVAVKDDATQDEVTRQLPSLDIPIGAISFETFADGEELTPSYELGTVSSPGTLRSFEGPIMGGKKIRMYRSTGEYLGACTVGFATTYNGAPAGVTNSHCTEVRGDLDGTYVGFPGYEYSVSSYVGREIKDPQFDNNCDWMLWQKCRSSDAAIFDVPSYQTQRGYIARPRLWHTDNSDAEMYVEIDPNKPTLAITGTADTKAGYYVDKIGQRTGWTYGVVEKTCVDTSTSLGHKFRCQMLSKAQADHGDSGAPVFYWDGDTVRFLGILWGRVWNSFEYYQVYSPDGRIWEDMGVELQVTP